MNHTIPLSGVVARLALRENLSEQYAQTFITEFFNTIEGWLAQGEKVSIKGLGTFELKEGVIHFIADSIFAETANSPFDMFSPVELGTDFDENNMIEHENEDPTETSRETEVQPVTYTETASEEMAAVEIEEEPKTEGTIAMEYPEEQTVADASDRNVGSEEVKTAEVVLEEAVPDEGSDEENELFDADAESGTRKRSNVCCIILWGIIGVIAGLVAGVFCGYVWHDKIDMILRDEPTGNQPINSESKQVVVEDNEVRADTTEVVITEEDIADLNNPATDPENNLIENGTKEAKAKEPRFDEIGSRRFLTTMAREYYGHPDYWVYIYKANSEKLSHPDKIKPGTRVMIPDFEEYRTSRNAEENLADAQRAGAEIYARFKF